MGRHSSFDLINPLEPRTRNVTLGGNRTSIRLEAQFWHGLEEIVRREGIPLNALVTRIRASQRGGGLCSAVRVFVQSYFFALAHNRHPAVPKGFTWRRGLQHHPPSGPGSQSAAARISR